MSDESVSVVPEAKSFSKMTKEQLILEATALSEQIKSLETQLAFFTAPTSEPGHNKLNFEIAEIIRQENAAGVSKNALSLKYRVSRDTIMAVLTGKIYKPVDPLEQAAKAEAKAKAEAEKAERKATREKARAEKQATMAAEKQARAAEREKAKLEKAAAKAKKEEDGTGPVKSAKSGRKVKAPAEITSMTPQQKKDAAAEMRRMAYERAQKRVAQEQAAQAETAQAAAPEVVEEAPGTVVD